MIFFTWGLIQQPTWVNWHSPLLENPCRGKAISSLFTVWLGETFPSLLWVRTWSIFRWAWSSTSTWTSAMKQTMERTIDEKARVLKTERVFDVSITQLRELVFKTKRMLNLKQLEDCYLDFCNSWVSYLQWLCLSVDVSSITISLITFNSQKPDFRFRWTFPRFLVVNQSLDLVFEESY